MFTRYLLKKFKKKVIKEFEKEYQNSNIHIEVISETSLNIYLKMTLDGVIHIQKEEGQVVCYPERIENGVVLMNHHSKSSVIAPFDGYFMGCVFDKFEFNYIPRHKFFIPHSNYDIKLITGFKIYKNEMEAIGINKYLEKRKIRQRNKKLNYIFDTINE